MQVTTSGVLLRWSVQPLMWRARCALLAAQRLCERSIALRTRRFNEWINGERARLDQLAAVLILDMATIDRTDEFAVHALALRLIDYYRQTGALERALNDEGLELRALKSAATATREESSALILPGPHAA